MSISKRARTLGMATLIATVPAAVMAQSQPAPDTTAPPAATRPDPAPIPPPSTKPSDPAQKPAIDHKLPDRSATAPAAKVNPMIGLTVFSSDGNKLGAVQSVRAEPDGKVKALHVKTGGFLGFGGKIVAIPEGKFTRTGENIQLGMTVDEVSKLPEVKDQS